MERAEESVGVAEGIEETEALVQCWAEAIGCRAKVMRQCWAETESLGIAEALKQCWAGVELFFGAVEDLYGGSRGLEIQ